MAYELSMIAEGIKKDPAGFARECDGIFTARVRAAADMIEARLGVSPIVLLSGPSGSGKTTTAKKIEAELERRGINTHAVSMDDYFVTVDPATAPRTPDGELDFESPKCLDMELLSRHFSDLADGREIQIPRFVFSTKTRSATRTTPMRLAKNEVAIFEGIHALNDEITAAHPEAFRLYISARSDVNDGGKTVFKGTWTRLTRRVVRDRLFRGTSAELTLGMWANIRRGEKLYISPFKSTADFIFDSFLPYEIPALKPYAEDIFGDIPPDIERGEELRRIIPALERFPELPQRYVASDSLIREFIGGGIYKY